MEFAIASTLTNVPQTSVLSFTTSEMMGASALQQPAVAVKTVGLPCGCVAVVAGAGVVSAGVVGSLLKPFLSADSATVRTFDDSVPVGAIERIMITSGLVTCMAVALLPGGTAALGVVGTSHGSLCLFVVDGGSYGTQPTIFKICETSLLEYSNGLISAGDAVSDVCIGFDPCGRPEFVAAATSTTVVVVDTQRFDDSLKANATKAVARVFARQQLLQTGCTTSETFCVSFPTAGVVRVLAPERYHAAFTMDIALVIVLDSGEVRYVERGVVGGSVQLLLEHHRQRQARQSEVGLSMLLEDDSLHSVSRALPHVVYAYNLSSLAYNVCVAAVGSHAADNIMLNDAALCYDSKAHHMRLIVSGAEMNFTERPGQLGSAAGWWAVAQGVVYPCDTLLQSQLPSVVSFSALKSALTPRNCRGFSAVLAVHDGLLLFACGNELHACSSVEPAGEKYSPLRHVCTTGSAISCVAQVELSSVGKSAVVLAYGPSLAFLLI